MVALTRLDSVPGDINELSVFLQNWLRNLADSMNYNSQLLDNGVPIGDGSALTISAGVVTVTTGFHRIDTQGAVASDDLDTVSGGENGKILVLANVANGRTVVVKNGSGNIRLAGSDFSLDNVRDSLTLIYYGSLNEWVELSRSNNS